MAIDGKELVDIADFLQQKIPSEQGFRSSTNRSYYGAFHECCSLADRYDYQKANKKHTFRHTELYNMLINHKAKTISENVIPSIGYLLKQLVDLRAKADYNSQQYKHSQAKNAILISKKILKNALKL